MILSIWKVLVSSYYSLQGDTGFGMWATAGCLQVESECSIQRCLRLYGLTKTLLGILDLFIWQSECIHLPSNEQKSLQYYPIIKTGHDYSKSVFFKNHYNDVLPLYRWIKVERVFKICQRI